MQLHLRITVHVHDHPDAVASLVDLLNPVLLCDLKHAAELRFLLSIAHLLNSLASVTKDRMSNNMENHVNEWVLLKV